MCVKFCKLVTVSPMASGNSSVIAWSFRVDTSWTYISINALTEASTEDKADSTHLDILRREIQEMSAAILHCRKEISSIKPEDGGDNRIMAATEECSKVVTHPHMQWPASGRPG